MGTKAASQLTFAFVFLLIGGGTYLLIRPPYLLMHKVVTYVGLGDVMQEGRMLVEAWAMPEWMLYNLPGALWAAAYILIIDVVPATSQTNRRLPVAAFIPCLGVGSELLQLAGVLPGTFDVLDMVAYALPYLIYYLMNLKTHDL